MNGLYWRARVFEEQGKFEQAIDQFEHRDLLDDYEPAERKRFYDGLRNAFKLDGARGYWQYRVDQALKKSRPDLYHLATLHMRLGQKDKAYQYLEEAYANHYCLEELLTDLCWDRNNPWFKSFARKIGLTQ